MDKAMSGSVCVEAQEYEAMRADALRYATILEHMESLVLRTPKGSTLTMTTSNRGSAFTRSGMDAALDGLRRGCEVEAATADQVQTAKTA